MHQQPRAIDAPGRLNRSTRSPHRSFVNGRTSSFMVHANLPPTPFLPPRSLLGEFIDPSHAGRSITRERLEAVERRSTVRRATAIVVLLLVILGGVAIGDGAYHAGVNDGLTQAGHASQVVRVVD